MRFSLLVMYCLLAFSLTLVTGCHDRQQTEALSDPAPPQALRPTSHRELEEFFASQNYDWDTLRDGVPPFILETLPADLHRISKITKKKELFFLSLLPMVLLANDQIRSQRKYLEEIFAKFDRNQAIAAEEMAQLQDLQREYGVQGDPLRHPARRRTLLERVDVIPPSLVLAQAATESAYGTSRFARRGNNIFGEWTFVPGTGMIPEERPEGATYEVRRFRTIADSLHSYMMNINTNKAYQEFRRKRSQLRASGQPLRGLDLADGLEPYSIRGGDYVEDLRKIILNNRLTRLSSAPLRPFSAGNGLLSTADLIHRSRSVVAETTAD